MSDVFGLWLLTTAALPEVAGVGGWSTVCGLMASGLCRSVARRGREAR